MPYKNPEEAKKNKAEYYLRRKQYLKEKQKEYYEANKDKIISKNKEWVEANKERVQENQKRWKKENPEKYKDSKRQAYLKKREYYIKKSVEYNREHNESHNKRVRAYKQTESGKVVAKAYRNSRRKREEDASLGRRYQNEVYEIYKQCALLRQAGHDVEVDHIVPLMGKDICGLHIPANLAIIPAKENRTKTNKFSQI
jgi:hypothetical protein